MVNVGYTIATEHFLRLFSYIITDKGKWQSVCADFPFTGRKWYFLETLSLVISHHLKGYPKSHRVLTEDDLIPERGDENIWRNRI